MTLSADAARQLSKLRIRECAQTLGVEIQGFSPETREVTILAQGRNEFRNPMGAIQGGFLCAMLDDAMALAAVFSSGFQSVVPTLESFYAPAQPGPIKGIGRVAKMGKTVVFLEGELFAADGELLAKASATARNAPMPKA